MYSHTGILTSRTRAARRNLAAAAALSLAVSVGGCAHVGEDEFEAGLEQVRAEMRAGDAAVEDRLGARLDGVDGRLASLESELVSLEEELDIRVERLEASLRVHTPVHFGFDRADVPAEAGEVLERLAVVLGEHYPGALVTVEGFTDPAGSSAYNERLGLRRAEAVRTWLVRSGGLPEERVRAVSYGETPERQVRPGEAGPGARGRENRRVVVVIDHAPGEGGVVATSGR